MIFFIRLNIQRNGFIKVLHGMNLICCVLFFNTTQLSEYNFLAHICFIFIAKSMLRKCLVVQKKLVVAYILGKIFNHISNRKNYLANEGIRMKILIVRKSTIEAHIPFFLCRDKDIVQLRIAKMINR